MTNGEIRGGGGTQWLPSDDSDNYRQQSDCQGHGWNGNSTFYKEPAVWRRFRVHIWHLSIPFQSFCRSLEDKIKEIKLESSGEHLNLRVQTDSAHFSPAKSLQESCSPCRRPTATRGGSTSPSSSTWTWSSSGCATGWK